MGVERITITLTSDMAESVKAAVAEGHYASNSEIVREALRDWRLKQLKQKSELEALRQDIARGLDDVEKDHVKDFDVDGIVTQGEKRLGRSD